MTKGGAIKPVVVIQDDDLRGNGGRFLLGTKVAQKVQGFTPDEVADNENIQGGALQPVYVIGDADLEQNGGRYILKGGDPIKVVNPDSLDRGIYGRHAIAVYPINNWPENPVNFDLSQITFTPNMGVRTGPNGTFAGSVPVQGAFNGGGTPDILSYPRGNLLGNVTQFWRDTFDPYQGTVNIWWTPEHDAADTAVAEYLWYISADYNAFYDGANNRFSLTVGGQTTTENHNIVAGTTIHLVLSWDVQNTIDGTNYARITIDDTQAYSIATQPTATAPDATIYIGSDGSNFPANGIHEGATIYRRVLFDGTYPQSLTWNNTGARDEIAEIYAAGAGVDPTLITGSWDVVFCMPTNTETTEALGLNPDLHAWSHPHDLSVPEHSFMQDGGYWGGAYGVAYNGVDTLANAGSAAVLDDLHAAEFTVGIWIRTDTTGGNGAAVFLGKSKWWLQIEDGIKAVVLTSGVDAITESGTDDFQVARRIISYKEILCGFRYIVTNSSRTRRL